MLQGMGVLQWDWGAERGGDAASGDEAAEWGLL